jgi:uncharacterized protein (DUF2141 family)
MKRTPLGAAVATAASLLLLATGTAAAAADLTIRIQGVRASKGDIYLGVFASPAKWPDGDRAEHPGKWVAQKGMMTVVLRGLPPGRYAAVGYHDENGNGELDTNLIGIPTEGYMFSNDLRPKFSAPGFDEAAFTLPPEGATITITVRY